METEEDLVDEWTEREASQEIAQLKGQVKRLQVELNAERQKGLKTRQELERLKSMKPGFRTTQLTDNLMRGIAHRALTEEGDCGDDT